MSAGDNGVAASTPPYCKARVFCAAAMKIAYNEWQSACIMYAYKASKHRSTATH